ncbi:cellulase family glycosylhydrolase [Gorillibacterium massiliense]|uniref:cellulase family glycosylhydrolase n=1 Tax=Gorillibacterium massiliense TaxID=1280390 RepID=UPI0004B24C24|nr:cellulase family glycosylhydrolase [Gorillibacterium massiliense]
MFKRYLKGLLICALVFGTLSFGTRHTEASANYYHTSGSKIVDSAGNPVVWNGINWFGFETSNYSPHGLWTRSMDDVLDQMKANGYNLIRLPYCNQMFDSGSVATSIDYVKNPDLVGLTPIQIMDKLIAKAGDRGMKIFLDRHRPDSGGQSELWYTSAYSEQRWIDDWKMLATRYNNNDTVIGADLHNEPHGSASWGTGNTATDWRLAAQRAGNAILSINPNWLIIVEGVAGNVQGYSDSYWWGGNLKGVANYPVVLNVPNQVVYSSHDYGPGVASQSWFSDSTFPNNMPAIWDAYWGYISKSNTAPVLVGEFGGRNVDTTSTEGIWQNKLVDYIAANKLYWTYWCLNPNSGDTGGLLLDDWVTWNAPKQAMLSRIIQTPGTTVPSIPTGLTAAAGNAQVALSWTSSSGATSYNVKRATVSGGPYTTVATGVTATSYTNTGLTNGTAYYYAVSAVNSAGESANSAQASATPTSGVTVPAAPTGLTATAGNAQVALSWTASAGATSYNVKRATTSGGTYTTVATGLTATSYSDTGLTNGTTYYYAVSAANSAGESTNSTQVSATPAASSTTSSLVVQYKLNNTNATDNMINATFNIKNTGTAAVSLSNLKLRYYFTKDGTARLSFWCDYAQVGSANVSSTFVTVSPAKTGADTYAEISFASGAGSIAAGGQSGDIQVRIAKSDWSNFNEADDYSFDATKTAYADWNKVTLYQSGSLVWGIEP